MVYANYTGYPVAHHPEELVSYFREDVGLSAFYSNYYYRYPSFLTHANYTEIPEDKHRGYRVYSLVKHLLTRYNMERLSNRLPFVEPVEYFNTIDVSTSNVQRRDVGSSDTLKFRFIVSVSPLIRE